MKNKISAERIEGIMTAGKIELDKTEENNDHKVIYPETDPNKLVRVYLNGYLIKTAYAIHKDDAAHLKHIKISDKSSIEQINLLIEIEFNGKQKSIELTGLLSSLIVTAWE